MTLRLQDTLTGETRPLEPLEPGHVRIYTLRPDGLWPDAHRQLPLVPVRGRAGPLPALPRQRVTWVMNITDVDDKIIRGANEAGTVDRRAGRSLARALPRGRARPAHDPPDVLPRATDHVEPMVALIERCWTGGHAYRTDDGSIFFRISSWPAYGRLARLDPGPARSRRSASRPTSTARPTSATSRCGRARSRASRPGTAIGEGRPGLAHRVLRDEHGLPRAESFDIHTGGVDLDLPAPRGRDRPERGGDRAAVRRARGCTARTSGSAGRRWPSPSATSSRVVDLLESGVSPRALRYALISVHYRQGIDYSDASLEAAAAAVDRLDALVAALEAYREDRADAGDLAAELEARADAVRGRARRRPERVGGARRPVRPRARAQSAHRRPGAVDRGRRHARWRSCASSTASCGVLPDEADALPSGAAELLAAREAARTARDWAASDRLRDELLALGVGVEDTRDGQRWRRLEAVR